MLIVFNLSPKDFTLFWIW